MLNSIKIPLSRFRMVIFLKFFKIINISKINENTRITKKNIVIKKKYSHAFLSKGPDIVFTKSDIYNIILIK